jgi:hypothetical protein
MFKRWKALVAGKRARGSERVDRVRLRRRIEQLEERAMLSATMGPMPHGGDGYSAGPQYFGGGPRGGDAAMFASPMRHDDGPHFQTFSTDGMSGGSLGGMRDRPASHALRSNSGSYVSGLSYGSTWNQFSYYAPPPPTTIYIVTIVTTTPVAAGDYWYDPPAPPPKSNSQGSTPRVSSPLLSSPILGSNPPGGGRDSNSNGGDGPARTGFASLNSLSTALAAIPTATQIITRDIDSATLFPTGALDAAFQSYASQLLLVASSSATTDRALDVSVDDASATHGEALTGFIRSGDLGITDDESTSTDAVQRELDAVDAVLRELHDFDKLSTDFLESIANDNHTDEAIVDVELRLSPDALGDAEGGMVMLEARGDANDSVFNLVGVESEQVDLLQVRAGVEAAVGFYQAIDVDTVEAPAANFPIVDPTTEATTEATRTMPGDNRLSTERETKSSGEAAAVIGATTFVGAMLWASSRRRSGDDLDAIAAAKKNCRSSAS